MIRSYARCKEHTKNQIELQYTARHDLVMDSDWLLLPCELWDQSSNFHKLKQFFLNLSATNDGAE